MLNLRRMANEPLMLWRRNDLKVYELSDSSPRQPPFNFNKGTHSPVQHRPEDLD